MEKIVAKTAFKFILVGIINTFLGSGIMFLMYNLLEVNYWYSSMANYIIGSIVSYFLNKYYTFQYKKRDKYAIIKFIINIVVCYVISYGVMNKLILYIFAKEVSIRTLENISMLLGMSIFIILNYLGQKFYVFNNYEKGKS